MVSNARIKRPMTPSKVLGISLILGLILLGTVLLAMTSGTAKVSYSEIWDLLTGTRFDENARLIILRIRLPRIFLAGLVGFSLSLGGVVFQALLRNPLADPFILGVSSGSAFGAVMGIFLGFSFHLGIPLMSFGGALLTINLVMLLGARRAGMESSTILLTGVIINAFFTAIIMFFVATASDSRLYTMLSGFTATFPRVTSANPSLSRRLFFSPRSSFMVLPGTSISLPPERNPLFSWACR